MSYPIDIIMDTKEKILKRSAELFPLMGIRNVTMDYLALDLNISKRTIYELFEDKKDLVLQCIDEMILNNNKLLLQIIEQTENVIQALFLIIQQEEEQRRGFNPVFVEDVKKYLPELNISFFANKEKMKEFSVSFIMLEKGMREGVFREDLQIEVVDNFLYEMIGIIHNSERLRLLDPGKGEILNNIFLPYFRGICTRKGLDLMDNYFEKLNKA